MSPLCTGRHCSTAVRQLPRRVEQGLSPPAQNPAGFDLRTERVFDPDVHLAIEPPSTIKTLEFEDVPFPYEGGLDAHWPGVAYSAPFRLLSEAGVRDLRTVIDENTEFAIKNERNHSLRGLGYRSQFVLDLSFCPEVLDLVSSIAREPLWPHDVLMHLGIADILLYQLLTSAFKMHCTCDDPRAHQLWTH
jgi:hypothetical protein